MATGNVRDPIAGLVLLICEYLRLVENGTDEEIQELRMRLFVKFNAVQAMYSRGAEKRKPDGE